MLLVPKRRLVAGLCLALAATPAFLAGLTADPPKPPVIPSPREVIAGLQLPPGLRAELVAAEPEIESPVAMAFDEDGRLWVVEMRDYPNGPARGEPPAGRIRLLEDRDGDGRYETSTIFAEHLLFANGLLPWRGGVIVTAAPHIVYLRDSDRDGKADRREVLYEGFTALNPQLRVSHPNLGIDNWIYVANGLRGGQAKRSGRVDAQPINLGGMDFRFDLVRDRYEAVSGLGQYGNTFDDWGRRFVCDNRHHLRHVVMPSRYIKRNPHLAVAEVLEDVSELELGPGGGGAKLYPLSKNWTTSSLHAGRFTAACSVFIYRGDLLPPEYQGAAFTCDPTGNLVHMEVLRPHGATFRAKPAREGVEFLATANDWSRPVFLANGPDGALYVIDMCRAVIEHPEFMPAELKSRPDLNYGNDHGRIYRIVPADARKKAPKPHLSQATAAELVGLLANPNAWWRTTAQRLILERQDPATVPSLRALCMHSQQPLARLHAAWLLESFGALDIELIAKLLLDEHPRVREHAVLLAESRLAKSESIQTLVQSLARDPDPGVRFQVALSLGERDDERILEPLAKIALAGVEDRWTRAAVASAVPGRAGALLAQLLDSPQGLTEHLSPSRILLVQELAALVGARRDSQEVSGILVKLIAPRGDGVNAWWMAGLNGLADGMGRRGTQLGAFLSAMQPKTAEAMNAFLVVAATLAADAKLPVVDRLAAVRLVAHAPWSTAETVLIRLFTTDPAQEIRLAAVRALAAQTHADVAGILMKHWKTYTPAVRREVTEAMFRQPDRLHFFLHELEAGRVKPGDVDAVRTRQLVNHNRPEIRERAKKLLHEHLPADRKQVLESYKIALTLPADPPRGRAVFQKHCATCHRVAGLGVDVGPDIADTRTKTPEALLTDILSPNQAIDNNYINYVVTTKSGNVLTGMIALETASSVTLRRAENQTDVVLRQDIDEMQSTGISLMPDGLEKTITVQEMADLVAFLKNWRYLDGAVPVVDSTKPKDH